ncbi:MAG: sigma-70 family RNA polymerase sigma factor [Gemmatimonadaceae bacterium]|nr:sigma-70 family RNA polymerase sigma factor [Gloeobacterales cyanobacterium ES-bin-141]
MNPRQQIVDLFSTFLQLDSIRFQGWVAEPRLRRSMQSCLAHFTSPRNPEDFWVLYWYRLWRKEPTSHAMGHLSAYLQESCYWAAHKMNTNFASTQYCLSDYFQIAIIKVDKVLERFDPEQGFKLKNYAGTIFGSVIRETLYQQQEADICTDWALLRKISHKRLVESLQSAGLSSVTTACYVSAWNCFRELYVPVHATGARKLSRPDTATWQAIARLYASGRGTERTPETLEQWMLACAKAVRSYLYPASVSANAPSPGQESGELLNELSAPHQSLLLKLIECEEEQDRQLQQDQLNTVLLKAVQGLDLYAQQLLQLYYGQGLTQQQMAAQLQLKQYSVSRQLTRLRGKLLLALARWSEDTLHTSLHSDLVERMGVLLEEWLEAHYACSDLMP